MSNTYTNPTWIKSKPHGSAEKQVGDSDTLGRTDVINRPVKGVWQVLKALLNTIADGAIADFSSVTDPSTTTELSGLTLLPVMTLTNRTGSALVVGDVCAVDADNNTSVDLDDTQASLKTFAVALDTPADAAAGRFLVFGIAASVKAQGTINRGDYIRKSATSKAVESTSVAAASTTSPPTGTVGIATKAAAGGLVEAILYGHTLSAASAPSFDLTPESAMFPNTNFPELVKNVGTNQLEYTLDYDQTTEEAAFWRVVIPKGFTVLSATIEVYSRQAAATSGTVGWKVTTLTRADGEAWDTAGTTDTITADTVEGTAGQVHAQTKALTVTGWAGDEVLYIKIARDTASDTVAEDAKLVGAKLRLA